MHLGNILMQGLRPTSRCKFIMRLGIILMHDLRPMRICHICQDAYFLCIQARFNARFEAYIMHRVKLHID